MRLRPNDLPEMELGEVRNVTFKLAGAVGANAIDSATFTCDRLTLGTPLISGTDVEVRVSADHTGTHNIIATATLDSLETIKGFVRCKVVDSSNCNERDYG